MSDFHVLSTNHTSFTVSNLDRSIAFFTEVLGFELLNRAPRDPKLIEVITGVPGADIEVAYIQGPGHRLELIQYHAPAERRQVESRPCDTGFAHVAYDVDDAAAAVAASAAHQGLPPSRRCPPPRSTRARTRAARSFTCATPTASLLNISKSRPDGDDGLNGLSIPADGTHRCGSKDH